MLLEEIVQHFFFTEGISHGLSLKVFFHRTFDKETKKMLHLAVSVKV